RYERALCARVTRERKTGCGLHRVLRICRGSSYERASRPRYARQDHPDAAGARCREAAKVSLMSTLRHREPGWADVLEDHVDWRTSHRLIAQLGACEAAALAFCRLLERWARGDAAPSTAGARPAALRHAAARIETALTGLDTPLNRYLLE